MMAAVQTAWQERAPRERTYLTVGALVVIAALIYTFAIEPLLTASRKAERALPALRSQASEMASLADTGKRLKSNVKLSLPSPDAAQPGFGAAKFGLSPKVTVSGDGSIDIQLNYAAMADLVDWLASLQAEQHLFVRDANLTVAGEGVINAHLVLAP